MKNLFAIFRDSNATFQGKEEGERVILIIRQHPFTLVYPLVAVLVGALAPLVLSHYLGAAIGAQGFADLYRFSESLWYAFLWLGAFYFLTMYSLNTVLVTDRRIIESEQQAFFSRKVAELHLYRVQDVTVETTGFMPTLLSFGSVMVQTAASEREFIFKDVGHPERVKDAIMAAVGSKRNTLKL